MELRRVEKDVQYVLNHCTKYLARSNADERHSPQGIYDSQPRARIADCWRYPVIDSHHGTEADAYDWNDVTFVWHARDEAPGAISLLTTAHSLHELIPMQRVDNSDFWSVTLAVRKAERHRYLFRLDGSMTLDPINPQTEVSASGETWSSFFTWAYPQPITFERWEFTILDRLTRHILPANSSEQLNFLSREGQENQVQHLFRLDISLGVANFIDKVVAKEERHHLYTYRTCLDMLDTVLRRRNGGTPPEAVEEGEYRRLYDEMRFHSAALFVDGWNKERYKSPSFFLQVLRRHAMSGAFSHPKYCGNPSGLGWDYLGSRFRTDAGATAFDWRQGMEAPLGTSNEYRG